MGDSTGSMFILFLIVIAVYVAGASIYTIVEKIRKKRREK